MMTNLEPLTDQELREVFSTCREEYISARRDSACRTFTQSKFNSMCQAQQALQERGYVFPVMVEHE